MVVDGEMIPSRRIRKEFQADGVWAIWDQDQILDLLIVHSAGETSKNIHRSFYGRAHDLSKADTIGGVFGGVWLDPSKERRVWWLKSK